MRRLTFAMLFATISTAALASTNYTQDARDLSAAELQRRRPWDRQAAANVRGLHHDG